MIYRSSSHPDVCLYTFSFSLNKHMSPIDERTTGSCVHMYLVFLLSFFEFWSVFMLCVYLHVSSFSFVFISLLFYSLNCQSTLKERSRQNYSVTMHTCIEEENQLTRAVLLIEIHSVSFFELSVPLETFFIPPNRRTFSTSTPKQAFFSPWLTSSYRNCKLFKVSNVSF